MSSLRKHDLCTSRAKSIALNFILRATYLTIFQASKRAELEAALVVKRDELDYRLMYQKLTNQFPAHRSAGAGDQNAFLLKIQLGFLV